MDQLLQDLWIEMEHADYANESAMDAMEETLRILDEGLEELKKLMG